MFVDLERAASLVQPTLLLLLQFTPRLHTIDTKD